MHVVDKTTRLFFAFRKGCSSSGSECCLCLLCSVICRPGLWDCPAAPATCSISILFQNQSRGQKHAAKLWHGAHSTINCQALLRLIRSCACIKIKFREGKRMQPSDLTIHLISYASFLTLLALVHRSACRPHAEHMQAHAVKARCQTIMIAIHFHARHVALSYFESSPPAVFWLLPMLNGVAGSPAKLLVLPCNMFAALVTGMPPCAWHASCPI